MLNSKTKTNNKTAVELYNAGQELIDQVNAAKQTEETNSTVSDDTSNVYDDALAKAKRDQNYKSYYNQAIQLYNMKNNANKYLQNSLANQGLNTQGYGSSASAGINNTAANLYQDAYKSYMENEQSITDDALSRYEENQTELDNQLVTFIQNATDKEQINKYLTNYGYMDKNGNYTEKWENLDSDRKAYIQSVIDGTNTTTDSNIYTSADDMKNAVYTKKDGTIEKLGDHFSEEIQDLYSLASANNYSKGTTVAIRNGEGTIIYVQWTGSGYKQVTESEYNSAKEKHTLTRTDDKKNAYDVFSVEDWKKLEAAVK